MTQQKVGGALQHEGLQEALEKRGKVVLVLGVEGALVDGGEAAHHDGELHLQCTPLHGAAVGGVAWGTYEEAAH